MRRVALVCFGLWVAAAPAAGQGGVEGTVSWRGRPARDAVVVLVGANENAPTKPGNGTIDQRHLRFTPRVVAVEPGSSVEFLNSDPVMHNVFSPTHRGAGFDLGTYPQFETRSFTFTDLGSYVVLCHVHPEMAAWVVVVPSRLHAVTDASGDFRISDVPPGEYLVQVSRRGATVGLDDRVVVQDGRTTRVRLVVDRDAARRGRP